MDEILVGRAMNGLKIALPDDLRCGHVQVVGSTGRGKTESVILPWMMQDMLQGKTTILIDGKGDRSIYQTLQGANQREEIAYFDLSNLEDSMSTNPLKYGSSQQILDRIFSSLVFENSYFKIVSEEACLLVIEMILSQNEEKNRTVNFKKIHQALSDDDFLTEILSGVQDQEKFEARFSRYVSQRFFERREKISGFLAQISPFVMGELAGVFNDESENSFSLSEILCPNLNKDGQEFKAAVILLPTLLYQQAASTLGKIFLQEVAWSVAMRERFGGSRFSSLFLDEFSSFVYAGFSGLLNKARSAKLAIHISHQSMGDLTGVSPSFAQIVHTNTNIKCVLGVNDPESADFFAKHFGTLETIEATERAEKNLFGEFERSGNLNIRQSEAYKIHPNSLKNFSRGRGVLSFVHGINAITEEIQFLRVPDHLRKGKRCE